jgi:hypothetical protein
LYALLTPLADAHFPGIVFWGAPIRHRITSQGPLIEPPHIGLSLSIPKQTLGSTEQDVDLLIRPCFNGPFELPSGYESTSPAYLVQPSRNVDIQTDVTLRIHHHARLHDEEDSEEMVFLSASATPKYRQSKPVYVFRIVKQTRGTFKPNSQLGEITLQHFCLVRTARRLRHSYSKGTNNVIVLLCNLIM